MMQQKQHGLIVYSKPSCMQRTMTYRVLDKKGIEYTTVDITTNPAALAYITEELGYSAARWSLRATRTTGRGSVPT